MTVVDASVVVDWVAPGIGKDSPAMTTLRRLGDEEEALVAPRLLLEEVANALLTGLRRQRWSGAEADAAYARLRRLPVQIVDDERDLDRAWDLARRYDDHPIYDLVYVALAQRRGAILITADDELRRRLSPLTGLWARTQAQAEPPRRVGVGEPASLGSISPP